MKISISEQYLNLLPRLSETEFESLKESIASGGLHVPIIVNKDGIVLDGHNRFRICKELGILVDYVIKEFDDPLEEKEFVIEVNVIRRHINDFQRGEIGYTLEGIEAEKAKQRQIQTRFNSAMGKQAVTRRWKKQKQPSIRSASPEANRITRAEPTLKQVTRSSQAIAKRVGLSRATYERIKKIIFKGSEGQKNALREGKVVGINKIYRQLRDEEKWKAKLAASCGTTITAESGNANLQLYHSDFRLLTEQQIPSESVDLIFTDPPDNGDCLPVYQDLARFGNKRLKQGGSLVAYVPQWALPTVSNYMSSNNLQYRWQICVELKSSNSESIHKYKVRVRYKLLLWFVKGPVSTQQSFMVKDIRDLIVLKPPEYNKHSTVVAHYLISNLSVERQLVVDPFLSQGSTGVAAISLNRRFIGSEIDQYKYTTAADRISRLINTTTGNKLNRPKNNQEAFQKLSV